MSDYVCGTGGWSGPKPGDPDNNVILTATPAFGGIDVRWGYPETNPHAVAYTILYRSTSPDPTTKVRHEIVNASYFYDRIDTTTPITYYYWIEIVSVHGTVGALIGPASAQARPSIEDTIIQLTGKIDEGVLAQSLKTEIARIQLNHLNITQEMIDRAEADDALGVAYNEVLAYNDTTRALLQEEVLARVESDNAFVSTVNTLYADFEDRVAAVQTIQEAMAGDIEAMASTVTTVEAELFGNVASGEVGLSATVAGINGKVTDIGALYTAKVNVNGLIGGFGVYNDGTEVEAGFDVDRFWVGRTGDDLKKPFIVEGGEVFMDEAIINKLTFHKLRADDGSLIFEDGKLRADFMGPVSFSDLQGDKPPADATRVVPQGEWATGKSYLVGDVVLSQGNGWICILNHTSTTGNRPPSNVAVASTWWMPFTVKGDTGPKGDKGDKGDQGAQGPRGYAGSDGISGEGTAVVYRAGTSVSTPPSGSLNPPTGWSSTAPTSSLPIWETIGRRAAGSSTWVWEEPRISTKYWTKPSQTLIDGNKIFTGDAYVDTLQIKGNAVTIPIAKSPTAGWSQTLPAHTGTDEPSWTRISAARVTMTGIPSGAPVLVQAMALFVTAAASTWGAVRVVRTDGGWESGHHTVYNGGLLYSWGVTGPVAVGVDDAATSGTSRTYDLYVRAVSNGYDFYGQQVREPTIIRNFLLSVVGVKR